MDSDRISSALGSHASFEGVLANYLSRVDAGEFVDQEAFVALHPTVAKELRAYFADAEAIEELFQPTIPNAASPTVHGRSLPCRFGDFELIEQVGRGGMGVVYRAKDLVLGRVVAIKVLGGDRQHRHADLERFKGEARAAAKLQHSGIVRVFRVGEHEGMAFIAMEFVSGASLLERIHEEPLSATEAASYMQRVSDAVQYAHEQGVLHRDLKPSNILISESNAPLIADFGLAKRLEADTKITETGQILGTASYMAPEQARGEVVRPEADVYALGATLYELLTGRPPFEAPGVAQILLQVVGTPPVPPRRLKPAVPKDLETICLKCLEKDLRHRYGSARELSEDLGRFLRGEPVKARPISGVAAAIRWAQRKPLVATLAGTLAAVMLVAAIAVPLGMLRWRNLTGQASALSGEKVLLVAQSYADAARIASQSGDWKKALTNLEQALKANHPDPLAIEIDKVEALQSLGRPEESRALLSKLAQRKDLGLHTARVLLLEADNLLVDGYAEGIEAKIAKATELGLSGPDDAYAKALLAPDSITAIRHLEETIRLNHVNRPFYRQASIQLLASLILLGKGDEAKKRAEGLLFVYPNEPTFAIGLAILAAIEQDRAQFEQNVQRIPKVDEKLEELLEATYKDFGIISNEIATWDDGFSTAYMLAFARVRSRLNGLGLRLPPATVKEGQRILPALIQLTLPFGKKNAAENLERILKDQPEAMFYFILGECYVASFDSFADGRNAFVEAAEAPSMFPLVKQHALYAAGMCEAGLVTQGQTDELTNAIIHLNQARALGRFKPSHAGNSYRVALRGKDFDLARKLLEDSLVNVPDEKQRLQRRADLELLSGQFGRARELIDSLRAVDANDSATRKLVERLKEALTEQLQKPPSSIP